MVEAGVAKYCSGLQLSLHYYDIPKLSYENYFQCLSLTAVLSLCVSE